MASSFYDVTAVRPGMLEVYRDYWERGVTHGEDGELINTGDLAVNELVEAKNKAAAEEQVRQMYPGFTVLSEATSRIGK